MAASERSRMARVARALHRLAAEPARKPGLPPIAAKADDLEAIKKAVEDAAGVGAGLWLSYLFVLFYIAVAAGAVTHVDLLLEKPVKLPFLGIELPLKAFFFLAPLLFLVTHAYTLAHFRLLADKARRFHLQLREQIPDDHNSNAGEIRTGLRHQLPSNIFVQFLAGPDDTRESWFGFLLKVIAWTTLVIGPVALILLLQIQFLPYHHGGITCTHRLALLAELLLVWWLWRSILSGRGDFRRWRWWTSWAAPAVGIVSSFVAALFSWTVATFPGEWQEDHLPSYAIVPTVWAEPAKDSLNSLAELSAWFDSTKPKPLHEWIFSGEVDPTTRRRESWFSNTLVLPGLNIYEVLKIDDPKKLEWKHHTFDLRGRWLDGAVFVGADLPKVDLTGAHLERAALYGAQLQGAALDGAQLQGASLDWAQLQGASLAQAQLQGASLDQAHLEGASLVMAQLQGASLDRAQLQGASLIMAQLQGASLDWAQLQGASLAEAQLQGASFVALCVWRADARQATWEDTRVARPVTAPIGPFCDWTAASFAALKQLIAKEVPEGGTKRGAMARCQIASNRDPLSRPIMTPSRRESLGGGCPDHC